MLTQESVVGPQHLPRLSGDAGPPAPFEQSSCGSPPRTTAGNTWETLKNTAAWVLSLETPI